MNFLNTLKSIFLNINNLFLFVVLLGILVLGYFFLSFFWNNASSKSLEKIDISKEYIEFNNDLQIIKIDAKNGFNPNDVVAKSNLKTILRFKTENTIDCTNAVNIPSLKIYEKLPVTGEKDIEIEPQPSGKVLIATCSVGQNILKIRFL